MAAVSSVGIPVQGLGGTPAGELRIDLLPGTDEHSVPPPLLDLRAAPPEDEPGELVQLLEGIEYRYVFKGLDSEIEIETDLPEIFRPDTRSGDCGRISPRLYTGTVQARVRGDGTDLGFVRFEVRSRKLDYRSEYGWMLRDISEEITEVILSAFAPATWEFSADAPGDAATLYQRFAFLRSLLMSADFEAALHRILAQPHHHWVRHREERSPHRGIPARSSVIRQIARPGPRVPLPEGTPVVQGLGSLPRRLHVEHPEPTVDTLPNRFVRFTLERWLQIVMRVEEVLGRGRDSPAQARGLREAAQLRGRLEETLARPLFREVSPLDRFPADDQVLKRREGYRQVYRAYLVSEVASRLSWSGGPTVYSGGKRDVAKLYEYWVYLTLGKIVSSLCSTPFDFSTLVSTGSDELSLDLVTGTQEILSGVARPLGRPLDIEFWYNRTFGTAGHRSKPGSWTRRMAPDYSIRISARGSAAEIFEDVWLHFDAKYRVEDVETAFSSDAEEEGQPESAEEEDDPSAKRADLLKMHAYRDAIRRSAGAYVLFPGGTTSQSFMEYDELLPGLGAFPLRPTERGEPQGAIGVRGFIEDVLLHFASRVTKHERARFWVRESYDEKWPAGLEATDVPRFSRPPADVPVLIGYMRGMAHREWVEEQRLYNVRADRRTGSLQLSATELAVEVLVLYSNDIPEARFYRVSGPPTVMTGQQLRSRGYPQRPGTAYLCYPVSPIPDPGISVSRDEIVQIKEHLAPTGLTYAPIVTNWLDLLVHARAVQGLAAV